MNSFLHRYLKNLSIRSKLTTVILIVCTTALAIACLSLFWFQTVTFKKAVASELQSLGFVISRSCAATLTFDDKKSATEVLRAFNVKDSIASASLFDSKGKLFASYNGSPTDTARLTIAQSKDVIFEEGIASLQVPVMLENAQVGTLLIKANFSDEYRKLVTLYIGVIAAIVVGSFVVIFIFSALLQGIIVKPILSLAEVAQHISKKQDYTVRAAQIGNSEVGQLAKTFNKMLDQIESRDAWLQTANAALECEISGRKQMEDELRKSRERYEVSVRGSSDGLWDWDLADGKLFFSARWKEMIGYADDEFPNEYNEWEARIHPNDLPSTRKVLDECLNGKKDSFAIEFRLKHKNGDWHWILSRAATLRDFNGIPIRLAGSHSDITERKHADAEMEKLNRQMADAQRSAGKAEVATGVLHNVGNVLNSVNVSATLVRERIGNSKLQSLLRATALLREHSSNYGEYLSQDPKGRMLPDFVIKSADLLASEQKEWLTELNSLGRHLEHIKEIVAMQQSYAKVSGVVEILPVQELVEDAIRINNDSLGRHGVTVNRDYQIVPDVAVDRNKTLQILVNLIRNAKQAMDQHRHEGKELAVRVSPMDTDRVWVEVTDNGAGIDQANISRIFGMGFTTKKEGHGFGLHSSAIAAKEMGGNLTAQSAGPGCGATFILELPIKQSL